MTKDKVYRETDKPMLEEIGKKAQLIWDGLAHEYMEANPRDGLGWGSCVVGEGFYVDFIPKRCRKPIRLFLCRSFGAACVGSLPWEHYIVDMVEFFESKSINIHFTYGRMD